MSTTAIIFLLIAGAIALVATNLSTQKSAQTGLSAWNKRPTWPERLQVATHKNDVDGVVRAVSKDGSPKAKRNVFGVPHDSAMCRNLSYGHHSQTGA